MSRCIGKLNTCKESDPRPDYSLRRNQKQANNRPEVTTNPQLALPNDQILFLKISFLLKKKKKKKSDLII